jgi:hypothetical protein
MAKRRSELSPPRDNDGLVLVRRGDTSVWWDRGDGLSVRLAASESQPAIERGRLSLLGVLVAFAAGGDRPR